jgi:hypothetical protein
VRIDIPVWLERTRAICATMKAGKPFSQWDRAIAAEAARVLRNIAGPGMPDRICVSLQDLVNPQSPSQRPAGRAQCLVRFSMRRSGMSQIKATKT